MTYSAEEKELLDAFENNQINFEPFVPDKNIVLSNTVIEFSKDNGMIIQKAAQENNMPTDEFLVSLVKKYQKQKI